MSKKYVKEVFKNKTKLVCIIKKISGKSHLYVIKNPS